MIDLRWANERDADQTGLTEIGLDVRHVPVLAADFAGRIAGLRLEEIYRTILVERGHELTSVVRQLSRRGALPAVVFCTAGKDRTGLVIALTLAAVGVLEEEIVADYSLTEHAMVGSFRRHIEATAGLGGSDENDVATRVAAPAATMHAVLLWLRDRHDGVGGYLKAHGMTQHELAMLHHAIVAPEAESSEVAAARSTA